MLFRTWWNDMACPYAMPSATRFRLWMMTGALLHIYTETDTVFA